MVKIVPLLETMPVPRGWLSGWLVPLSLAPVAPRGSSGDGVGAWRDPGGFPCPRCPRAYRYRQNMLRHLKLECGVEPQCSCDLCGYRTKRKSSLQRHMATWHGPSRTTAAARTEASSMP